MAVGEVAPGHEFRLGGEFDNFIAHIGIAVDTEAGLIVPVIRDADRKSMLQLARDLADVATRTRERKVSMDDLAWDLSIASGGGWSNKVKVYILAPAKN